jgi:CheY-like chemotaxis protein
MKEKDVYRTGEAATFLDLPRRTVSKYCMTGRIPATQHPISKMWRIKHNDLVAFMGTNGVVASESTPSPFVLIVDDEQPVINIITRTLSHNGWNLSLDSVTSGYDALVKIGAEIPDLVILDIKIPEMNGKEVLRTLKRGEKTRNIKVLVVAGYPEEIDEMMHLGADAALAKPFKGAQLTEAVAKLLPSMGHYSTEIKIAKE